MIQTVEAVIDEQGAVRLLSPVTFPYPRRALVTTRRVAGNSDS